MRFDREKLFTQLRKWRGHLTAQQVAGINYILDAAEQDKFIVRVEWLAYMLATTHHETADTYQPIHEYGGRAYFIKRYGSQTKVGKQLGNDTPEEGAIYAGVGDVQLTGETNYEKAENALREYYPEIVAAFEKRTGRKFDLTVGDQPDDHDDPKNAGDPAIAYAIMSFGMRAGMFTGKSLKTYTTAKGFNEVEARRIINGTDHAALIAATYRKWLAVLKASLITSAVADSQPDKPAIPTAGLASDVQAGATEEPQPPTNNEPPQEPGQTIVDVPPVVTETEPSIVSKIKGWYAALPATILTALGGVWSWIQGAATEIIIAFFVTSGVIAITYIIATFIMKNKREQRQFEADQKQKDRDYELTKLQLESAMDPKKQTVRIAPPSVEIPSSDTVNA